MNILKNTSPLKLCFLIVFCAFCSLAFGPNHNESSKLKDIVKKYSDSLNNPKYGMAILVKHKGKMDTFALGWADEKTHMTADKIFNIGSLTKMFTAVLIMQEVEKGTLKLTDTLGQFFPKNKNVDGQISIEMLLKHRSGLGEVGVDTLINRSAVDIDSRLNFQNLYEIIPAKKFNKDEKFEYTNTNYLLLGYILEKTNDKPYDQLLQERIFDVCGMKNSYAYFSNAFTNGAHSMLGGQDIGPRLNYRYYKNFCFSAGGISSTLVDLSMFFHYVYETEKLLKQKTFEQMQSFDENDYGLGIERIKIAGSKGDAFWLGHAGDNISYKMRNYYNPRTKDLIIVATNQMGDRYSGKVIHGIFGALDE